MDEKKKQVIEEMAKAIVVNCGECYTCKYYDKLHCADLLSAEGLYNAGYRKESDTAREIFEKIFEVLCCFTTQGKSKEYNEGYIDCLAEVDKRLQNLAKEKYGVDLGE
jgi:hypothetical protein